MSTQDKELPPEIAEIHGHIGLVNPIRAQVCKANAQTSAQGFTQLSTMIHLTNYGVNRMLRALARGSNYESALDNCYYVGHLGEAEIPHLKSVEFFPFDELSDVELFKDKDGYCARYTFAEEEFSIRSEDLVLYELFQKIKKSLED
jgi:hypothetical protein